MKRARWESENGITLELSANVPYLLRSLSGNLMDGEAEAYKPPRTDGQNTVAVTNSQRRISISGSIVSYGSYQVPMLQQIEQDKNKLLSAFDPKYFGTLYYYNDSIEAFIRCRPVSLPQVGTRFSNSYTFDVDFISDDSYWRQSKSNRVIAGQTINMFVFPWVIKPTVFSTFVDRGLIDNPTYEDIYPTIEIYTTSEWVRVLNSTTGKFIQITQPIADGQKLVIDMENTEAYLWQIGEDGQFHPLRDVSNWVTLDSDYWPLVPGNNEIITQNEDPNGVPVSHIKYYVPVTGV